MTTLLSARWYCKETECKPTKLDCWVMVLKGKEIQRWHWNLWASCYLLKKVFLDEWTGSLDSSVGWAPVLLYEKKVREGSFLLIWCSKPQSSPLCPKNVQAPFKRPSHIVEAPLTQDYICNWKTIQWGVDRHGITSNKHNQHDCTHTSLACVLYWPVLY